MIGLGARRRSGGRGCLGERGRSACINWALGEEEDSPDNKREGGGNIGLLGREMDLFFFSWFRYVQLLSSNSFGTQLIQFVQIFTFL